MSDPTTPRVIFCGCWHDVGHMTWLPSGKYAPRDGVGPWRYLDTRTLHPGGDRQGAAKITQLDGWTALGIIDRTIDSRPGSHATFATEGTHDFDQMLALATAAYPKIIARVGPVVLAAASLDTPQEPHGR